RGPRGARRASLARLVAGGAHHDERGAVLAVAAELEVAARVDALDHRLVPARRGREPGGLGLRAAQPEDGARGHGERETPRGHGTEPAAPLDAGVVALDAPTDRRPHAREVERLRLGGDAAL